MNQKGLEFTSVGPIEDIQLMDFGPCGRLLWGRQALGQQCDCCGEVSGLCFIEIDCGLVDLGGGDGGSLMMVAWPVAWASWLELVVAVGVSVACAVGAMVFLGGMVKNEMVSSR